MSNLIYKKMNDVMKAVGPVTKDKTNSAQGFKFRGIDQFVNALHPALANNGVFMTTDIVSKSEVIKDVVRGNGKPGVDKHVALTVKYTFHAEDGSSVSSTIASEGLDSGDKATNKALSAALKYALIQTFSVPTEDMAEADSDTPVLGRETGKDPVKSPQTNQFTSGHPNTTPLMQSGGTDGRSIPVAITASAPGQLSQQGVGFKTPERPNPVDKPQGFRRPVKVKNTSTTVTQQQTQGDDL